MRILLLTDSLGCPRPETSVSTTWTERILREWSSADNVFYTYCRHGLSANMIDLNYIREIEPSIIITQFGIVDACRRALKSREMSIASSIPGIGDKIKRYCSNHHYKLSARRNIHYCDLPHFARIVEEMTLISNVKVYFIKISQPGKNLIKKIYDVENDINSYNHEVEKIDNIILLDPYKDIQMDKILLNDGHHLTDFGHNLVFECINNQLKIIIGEAKNV